MEIYNMGKICASALPNHLNVVRMFLNIYIFYIQLIQPVALKKSLPKPNPCFPHSPKLPSQTRPKNFYSTPQSDKPTPKSDLL